MTFHRGKPILFQVDLADQKNHPKLTASGDGTVTLWELKKDGEWTEHPLPYDIPAEQSAGPSSDPGSYMIQGITAGSVTLQITANGALRADWEIQVRSIDLDVDSNNSGQVNLSNSEELIEEDPSQPGKILPGGDALESDANGIPLHPEKLTSLKLQTANLHTYPSITFSYPEKALKIWKTPLGQTPTPADLLVPGQSYAPTDLGLSSGSTAEFSVQAIASGLGLVRIGVPCANLATANIRTLGVEDGILVNLPVKVMDNAFATGVDDVSCTAKSTDPGYQPDTWIMAPSGTVPDTTISCANDTIFRISPGAGFQLHVAATAAGQFTATPDSFPTQGQAPSPGGWPVVSWHGESIATSDPPGVTPVWTVTPTEGSPATITLPVKVKVMKNRKVKVVVHYVTGQYKLSSGTMEPRPPTAKPTADEIKEKLRNVFSKQINNWFEDLVCRDEAVDWDTGKDSDWGTAQNPVTGSAITEYNRALDLGGWWDIPGPDRISVEEQKPLALRNAADKAIIDVFVVGGCWNIQSYKGTPAGVLNDDFDPNHPNDPPDPHPGLTKRERRTVYLAGENVIPDHPVQKDLLLQDIAHEIGHVIIGLGHPDDLKDNGAHAGVAPLEGTNTLDRLIHSDEKAKQNAGTLDRNLIVKGEWDAAEAWLKKEEDEGRLPK